MTTQREPDTSAEGLMLAPSRLRWWRGKVSNWLHRQEPIPRETPDGISLVDELGAAATEIERLRALADTAECKGENTKLARTAIATASGEWTPTHRHANGDLYRLLPVEFHWEPEWDKPAVLYENAKGVKIGRFADVFAARFTPLAPASEEACSHPKTVLHHTGDGTPVEFCPDCGRNVAIGNPPAKEGTTDANDHA